MGKNNLDIISFFAGAGGLDSGFHNAGFNVLWANEFDKKVTPTLKRNFPDTIIDDRSLFDVPMSDIPDNITGIVGGPPCQSWSIGGLGKGLEDRRGQVFLEYINVIKEKQPLFFLAENVKGMLAKTRKKDLDTILEAFDSLGYTLTYGLVNAADYGVPQDRWRVFFVGYHKSLGKQFVFPEPFSSKVTLREAISDLRDSALPGLGARGDSANSELMFPNHEYVTGTFSSQFMSRNRTRLWDETSFTIQASGRHAPLHPDSGLMVKTDKDLFRFNDPENLRRLSVREAARIQTFPDSHDFVYDRLEVGYKMVGNAVPVKLAEAFASKIMEDLLNV